MKVIVACEESQRACIAFRKRGHEAYSCDIQDPSGGHPEWHILGDALKAIEGGRVNTMDGKTHDIGRWDLLIAHILTLAGNKWFKPEFADRFPDRQKQRNEAVDFFMALQMLIATESPLRTPSELCPVCGEKPDQYIEPYLFGDPEKKKKTGLWLKGLPLLKPTNIVEPVIIHCKSGANEPRWHMETMRLSKEERSRARSRTFLGIAEAMAEQWGGLE